MMKKMLCITFVLLAFAGPALAVGDSIFLRADSGVNAGLWLLGLNQDNPANYLSPTGADGGWAYFNDAALSPNPNTPLLGDVNGDGVSDLVTVGSNGAQNLFLGRNTATTGNNGDLLAAPVGGAGWPDNFVGTDNIATDFFIADVDGDGYGDAVTRKPTPWDGGATSFWESYNSDADGIEGGDPTISYAAGIGNYANTAIMGDFNGDGAVDLAEHDPVSGLVVGLTSTPGSGLDGANAAFWGAVGVQAGHVATLVGDINGDGLDDIVEVDDRNSNGLWTWVAGLTGTDGAIPAGVGINVGGMSWVSPFGLRADSISATPLLADLDGDGKDDLVLYEEYNDAGVIWARILYGLNLNGNLFDITFNNGAWHNLTANGIDSATPLVGVAQIVPEPATLLLLGIGGLVLRRRKKSVF